jgi:ATP adenylyltransferase
MTETRKMSVQEILSTACRRPVLAQLRGVTPLRPASLTYVLCLRNSVHRPNSSVFGSKRRLTPDRLNPSLNLILQSRISKLENALGEGQMTDATTRFDFIVEPRLRCSSRLEDTFLAETRSFAVVPSLGSLVPGWLLVVPKRRILNCSMLAEGERSELKDLIVQLTEALRLFPGQVFAFEHGASHVGSLTGCGVDQAHIHLVPLEFDLLAAASDTTGVRWDVHECGDVVDLIDGHRGEYVAIHDCGRDRGILGRALGETSQWVRKVIAAELNRADEWDYRTTPQHDLIAVTVGALRRPLGIRA